MGRRVGSSEVIEIFIAVLVGLLAVLGALFCIGLLLLVEPVRNPVGENDDMPLSKCCRMTSCFVGVGRMLSPIKFM